MLISLIALARLDAAGENADVGDDAAVNIEDGIEDEPAQDFVGRLGRRRNAMHDRLEDFLDADAHLRAGIDRFLGRNGEDFLELFVHRGDVGIRQIDLVDDRDDGEALFVREMHVRHRLRLDALRGIDDQQRAFAGRE